MSHFMDVEKKTDVEHFDGVKRTSEDGPSQNGITYVPGTDEEKRLVRKIDRRMVSPQILLHNPFGSFDSFFRPRMSC